ncbi:MULTISPECIES: ABC transporter substrate-binding protein [unclassified Paracoccus (in: a-proteobacteria)]|uniref:ABC transporter substrate-binding protein n=1 Tax=unclassified Paracoccus (in: a-proteobacteria) TaxID=2688777 RepID=UPI00160264F9|nr:MULTISPECIES: ABC transporter substrate-binding protein [unclassified Paracoccus (in: a-proteobacteria)]MBB1490647.1 ABC transporter substrate-binding protein [Paracoccus sp. MC1854]MBB1497510.1 ABC transporter substrate-binding protein [Paracoccus sp. MC1862]QQO45983.1 ABC transporter substrate-binding protein [Paracoccus sp. MC1862]
MKQLMVQATALCALALPAHADLTVMSWGGAYEKSQVEAYNKPFTAETGIAVNMTSADNPAGPIKSMVDAGNVTIDVVDLEYTDAVRLCDEGVLEEIDHSTLPPAPDGTPAAEDFLPNALTDCAVASMVFATVYGFDTTKFTDEQPSTIADLFDAEKFPGKRGLRKGPKINLEIALMADGVPAAEVYDVLATPEGIDRAFAKLDTIKPHVVWWEAGSQPPQLLADGEVAMTTAYNGRLFSAIAAENKPFKIVWDGQVQEYELFAVPKGTPNRDAAMDYIRFATGTQRLADQTKWIAYGPARKSSIPLVGTFEDGTTEMKPFLPTNQDNMANALQSSHDFWVDRETEITERFTTWLSR